MLPKIKQISQLLQCTNRIVLSSRIQQNHFGTVTSSQNDLFLRKDKTSKAMKAYLERAQEHDEFMKTQREEFELGKRHLANIMGEDPILYEDQAKIDEAIQYLMPSALYDKRARPMMKPPEEVFPERKAAEFDETGRPHSFLFYTGKANFFQLLYDAVEHLNTLNKFEDEMIRQQKTLDPALQLELSGSEWISKDQLELKLVETIQPVEHRYFVNTMTRLAEHPYSYRVKDFIDQYRKPLMNQQVIFDIPKPQIDQDGRQFITVYECLRKKARADVTVRAPGTGKISINGQPITYFEYDQSKEQLAADLGHSQCLEVLLNAPKADPNIRICIREKESTALHLAADEGNVECVALLLAKGADAKVKNHRGFTPLHLAARTSSLECVELLLRDGSADPNSEDFDHRTPLHAAIGKSDSAYDIIEALIGFGANINAQDVYGFTALHLAALDGLAHCVDLLLYHGADVSTKSRKGTTALNVINRKTPASLNIVSQKLDEAITLTHSQDNQNREIELELDFRSILQYCHPREISYLNTFVDEGNKEILQHPLCSAFLYIKWGKIRKYYIARLLFCFTFVLFLTLYVLTALAHNCYNGSKDMEDTIQEQELCQKQSILGDMLRNNPFVMDMQWWVLVAITIVEIFRKFYGITGYSSFKHYIRQMENSIEWFVICSVFMISHVYTDQTYTWQNHVGAFAVLLGWTNLMLMIGQLPALGAYVAMYTKVQGEFAKLFAAYSCMLIGFTISFCVIFPSSSAFANPFMGFITVLVMMTGENDVSILVNDPDGKDPPFLLEVSAQVTFILFLLFVTVVLMNLLVGIAVHDIQGLKKTADLSKLVRQTKLISYIESALFTGWLPNWLRSLLHYTALVSPQAYRVVLSVRPLNPGEKRLPRHILMSAYEIASRTRKHYTVTSKNSNVSYFSYKNKLENNSATALAERSVDSDYFETDSMCTLTNKIEESTEKIDQLTNEVRELKAMIVQDRAVIDKLITLLSYANQNVINSINNKNNSNNHNSSINNTSGSNSESVSNNNNNNNSNDTDAEKTEN